jgi:molybdenum cofactor cytidylyltransferase
MLLPKGSRLMATQSVVVVIVAGIGTRFREAGRRLCEMSPDDIAPAGLLESTLQQVRGSGLPFIVITTASLAPEARQHVAPSDLVVLDTGARRAGEEGIDEWVLESRLGIGQAIAAGVSARSNASGWLVLPGDLSMILPDTLHRVAGALRESPVTFARYRGQPGHPVAFAAELYSELIRLHTNDTARRLLGRYPALGVDVDDIATQAVYDAATDLHPSAVSWPASD